MVRSIVRDYLMLNSGQQQRLFSMFMPPDVPYWDGAQQESAIALFKHVAAEQLYNQFGEVLSAMTDQTYPYRIYEEPW